MGGLGGIVLAGFLLVAILKSMVVIINQYERGVVFFLGKLDPNLKQPGLRFIIPFVQKIKIVDQRTVTMDVPSQDVITRDNVSVKVNAVLYFRVLDPSKALVQVENYLYATSMLAQTTLRSVCGEADMDDLLQKRDELNKRIQEIVDLQTDPWGVKVASVEIKHIDLPQEMQRAMAKQAEAERDRRAKIIQAEGEFQSAGKLKDAADIISQNPAALQLRYLDTLKTISTENSSTIIFPMPINILETLAKKFGS
jgi:regulator of protease activity HflC (stomatin/prohibitin superfamily)